MLFIVTEFIGNFHPVLVHLPIGILLFALVLELLQTNTKYQSVALAIPIAYLTGATAAILSCITGWLLSNTGEYNESTLNLHRWMGIAVAIVSVIGYYFSVKKQASISKYIAFVLGILLFTTGHFGGTLTHGDGYLTKAFSATNSDTLFVPKPITNAQEALIYKDIIQPILTEKCIKCHSGSKQKGNLRLDTEEGILKGGKGGAIISVGHAEKSEIFQRVSLDPLNEKHMPPKGKTALTEQERLFLQWWIQTGVGFSKKVKELDQPNSVKLALTALEKNASAAIIPSNIPNELVDKANESLLIDLQKKGIVILPIAQNSNYLSANLINLKTIDEKTIAQISDVKKQLIWLRMPAIQLSDGAWQKISSLQSLTKLSIEHSNITDKQLLYLSELNQLQYLNLVGTTISSKALLQINGWTKLSQLYLGSTHLVTSELIAIQSKYAKTQVDTGGYRVATLVTDTQLVKAPIIKK